MIKLKGLKLLFQPYDIVILNSLCTEFAIINISHNKVTPSFIDALAGGLEYGNYTVVPIEESEKLKLLHNNEKELAYQLYKGMSEEYRSKNIELATKMKELYEKTIREYTVIK